MDLNIVLTAIGAFGVGGIVSGVVVNHLKETTARRTMRADLLEAQRELANVEYDDINGFIDASNGVMRQAMIAGVPQWLLRHYGAVAGLERNERELELSGLLQFHEQADAAQEVKRIPREVVALLYSDAEHKFNYGIWHPFLVKVKSGWWRFKWNRFYWKIGHRQLGKQMRRETTI